MATKKPAVPQAPLAQELDDFRINFIRESTVLNQYPDTATMGPNWALRLNPKFTTWIEPADGPPVEWVDTGTLEREIDGKMVQFIAIFPSAAGKVPDLRKVTRQDGRSGLVNLGTAFLEVDDFVNTGVDNYIFPAERRTHREHGRYVAINVTNYLTRSVESKPEGDKEPTKESKPTAAVGTQPAEASSGTSSGSAKAPAKKSEGKS